MNSNIITCPNCKTEIPLTDAMAHQVREQMEKEFAVRQRQLQESVAAREKAVADQARGLEQAQQGFDRQVAERLASERKKLQAEAQEQAKQDLKVEMQDLRTQLDDRQQKLAAAQSAKIVIGIIQLQAIRAPVQPNPGA